MRVPSPSLRTAAAACGAEVVAESSPSLDEIFVARVGERSDADGGA
jgi:hypothetical protein